MHVRERELDRGGERQRDKDPPSKKALRKEGDKACTRKDGCEGTIKRSSTQKQERASMQERAWLL